MKKVLILIVFLTAPFLMMAQNDTTSTKEEVKTEVAPKQTAEAKFRAKAADMNYKKSNDIISIKAYRKSLQIKVKEVKLC